MAVTGHGYLAQYQNVPSPKHMKCASRLQGRGDNDRIWARWAIQERRKERPTTDIISVAERDEARLELHARA
jgi:hypothetical protein